MKAMEIEIKQYQRKNILIKLDKIRSYLKDIINNLKNVIRGKFYKHEEHVMHLKNGNVEITINDKIDEVIADVG